jgi:hypothetical protein
VQNSDGPRGRGSVAITALLAICVTLGYSTTSLYGDLKQEIRDNRDDMQRGYNAIHHTFGEFDVRLATCYGETQHLRTRMVTLERILSHTQDKVFKLLMKAPAPQAIPMHPPFDSWQTLNHVRPMYGP